MRQPRGLPTASRLQLALACPASQALGQVDTLWQAGEDGKERHEALASVVSGEDVRGDVSEATKDWLMSLEDEHLAPLLGAHDEVTVSWDHFTHVGRIVGRRLERAYEKTGPAEYVGTADYIHVTDGRVHIIDLKTGHGDVPHPSRNAQLRFLALAACRAYGVESARVGILHAPEGRMPWWQWAELDAFELEVVASELRSLAERIGYARKADAAGKTPWLRAGEHCTYCPARFACPARTAMVRALANANVADDWRLGLEDDVTALRALERWQAARKAIDEVGKALHARAAERPIPLADGRVWGPVETTREVIDAEKAWPALDALLGAEATRAALTVETSKAGIERAVKAAKAAGRLTGTIKAGVEQALAAVRAAGAVETKTRTEFEAAPPGRPQ